MNTSVASNSRPLWLNTRASSIVSAMPLPSSLTPAAAVVGASGSALRDDDAVAAPRMPALLPLWPPAMATRVVVAADVDPPRAAARQDGHDVARFHVARDAALLGDPVGVEGDLQPRAVALHLVEDPLARRADAASSANRPTTSCCACRTSRASRRIATRRSSDTCPTSCDDARIEIRTRTARTPAGRRPAISAMPAGRWPSHDSSVHSQVVEVVAGFDPLGAAERSVVEIRPGSFGAAVVERDGCLAADVEARVGLARRGSLRSRRARGARRRSRSSGAVRPRTWRRMPELRRDRGRGRTARRGSSPGPRASTSRRSGRGPDA